MSRLFERKLSCDTFIRRNKCEFPTESHANLDTVEVDAVAGTILTIYHRSVTVWFFSTVGVRNFRHCLEDITTLLVEILIASGWKITSLGMLAHFSLIRLFISSAVFDVMTFINIQDISHLNCQTASTCSVGRNEKKCLTQTFTKALLESYTYEARDNMLATRIGCWCLHKLFLWSVLIIHYL